MTKHVLKHRFVVQTPELRFVRKWCSDLAKINAATSESSSQEQKFVLFVISSRSVWVGSLRKTFLHFVCLPEVMRKMKVNYSRGDVLGNVPS